MTTPKKPVKGLFPSIPSTEEIKRIASQILRDELALFRKDLMIDLVEDLKKASTPVPRAKGRLEDYDGCEEGEDEDEENGDYVYAIYGVGAKNRKLFPRLYFSENYSDSTWVTNPEFAKTWNSEGAAKRHTRGAWIVPQGYGQPEVVRL